MYMHGVSSTQLPEKGVASNAAGHGDGVMPPSSMTACKCGWGWRLEATCSGYMKNCSDTIFPSLTS